MKIIFIIKSFAIKAGVERIMSDKMNYMAEQNHEVTLITYEQGTHPISFPLHSTIKHIDLDTRLFTLKKYTLPLRIIKIYKLQRLFRKRLQQVVDTIQPDIINTTTYSLNLMGCILGIKTNAKRTIESHINYTSILKENDFKDNVFLKAIAKCYDYFTLKKIKKFDALFTLTKGDACHWKQYTDKIYVIPNPVTHYPESVKEHDCSHHRIICAGRLDPQKGFDLLIESFSLIADSCPEWQIDIFGSGDEEQKLRTLISSKGLDKKIFIHPASNQIYEEFQNSDFFVFCSRYEGWGLVLVEAMSCGIPAVSFRCDYGPEDIITNYYDGILVKNGDITDLANKILWMIQHPQERTNMGRAARITAKNFQKTNILEQWKNALQSLIF